MNPAAALREFADALRLPECRPDAHGECQIPLDDGHRLGLREQPGMLLLHVARPLDADAIAVYAQACKRVCCAPLREDTLQIALRRHEHRYWLVALLRVPEEELSAPRLVRAYTNLRAWLEQI